MNEEERKSLMQLRSEVEQLKNIMQPRKAADNNRDGSAKQLARERYLLNDLKEMPSINFTRDAIEKAQEARKRWETVNEDGKLTTMLDNMEQEYNYYRGKGPKPTADLEDEAPMLIGNDRAKSAAHDLARKDYLQRALEIAGGGTP